MVPSSNDCTAFRQGTHVSFRTLQNLKVEGDVVCFDPTLKALVIRSKDDMSGKQIVRLFNLSMIKDTLTTESTKSEVIETIPTFSSANGKKANERIAALVATRRHEIMPVDNIPVAGQQAFLQLRKMLPDTRWDGPNIRVFAWVVVKSPYNQDSAEILRSEVHNDSDEAKAQNALNQVKKTLAKTSVPDDRLRADFFAPFNVDTSENVNSTKP